MFFLDPLESVKVYRIFADESLDKKRNVFTFGIFNVQSRSYTDNVADTAFSEDRELALFVCNDCSFEVSYHFYTVNA